MEIEPAIQNTNECFNGPKPQSPNSKPLEFEGLPELLPLGRNGEQDLRRGHEVEVLDLSVGLLPRLRRRRPIGGCGGATAGARLRHRLVASEAPGQG